MDFEYIPTSVRGPGSDPNDWELLAGCDCTGECSAEQNCACLLGAEPVPLKGFGVRALREIPKGVFICEYAGEVLNKDEVERRAVSTHDHNYTLTIREHGEVVFEALLAMTNSL
ncbi:hypothetical protein COOONC_16469 [Cooperia oncophora]